MQKSVDSLIASDKLNDVRRGRMVTAVQTLDARITAVNESIQETKADLILVRTERVDFTERSGPPQDVCDHIMDHIIGDSNLGTQQTQGGNRGEISSASVVSPSKSDSGVIDEEQIARDAEFKSILDKLVEDVKLLQVARNSSAVKFGNLGISNLRDCTKWINENFNEYQYGLIIDPLIMLDRIHVEDIAPANERSVLAIMELQRKMNIRSANETAVLDSLRFSRPRVFHTGRPSLVGVQNVSRLNVLPTHLIWNPGGDGVMDRTMEKMNILEAALSAEIPNTFKKESMAHWIATKCLSATVSFLNQLFASVETIYKRLHNFSKFTTAQAWSLTTQVLDRILADLFLPKDNLLSSLLTDNTPVTCAQVMFASFRMHDIMAVYVTHKFENHPSVSTEYVKFLATNSGSEKVTQVAEALAEMKLDMKNSTAEAKAAAKKADIATSRLSDLSTKVTKLEGTVESLVRKVKELLRTNK